MKGDRLAEALGGRRVDGLAKLPAGVLDDVADMVLDARAAQVAALEESLDASLRIAPWPLRGVLRKVLVG
jgi:hypothetical protein